MKPKFSPNNPAAEIGRLLEPKLHSAIDASWLARRSWDNLERGESRKKFLKILETLSVISGESAARLVDELDQVFREYAGRIKSQQPKGRELPLWPRQRRYEESEP